MCVSTMRRAVRIRRNKIDSTGHISMSIDTIRNLELETSLGTVYRMKAVLQRRVTSIRWTELFITGAENLTFHHGSTIQAFSILST